MRRMALSVRRENWDFNWRRRVLVWPTTGGPVNSALSLHCSSSVPICEHPVQPKPDVAVTLVATDDVKDV